MRDIAAGRIESDAADLFQPGKVRVPARSSRHPAPPVKIRPAVAVPPLTERDRSPRREPRKIRYSDSEWATVVARARECGKAPARYVREVSLGAVPKAKRSHANSELVRELGRVGNALVRLAANARDAGAVPDAAAFECALADVLAVVRRID